MLHRIPRHLIILLLLSATATCVIAKIGDPPVLLDSGIKYQSHENYIEAIDSATGAQKWSTVLYESFEPLITLPIIEQDAQWNIIAGFEIKGELIYIRDGDGNQYKVNKKTGIQIFDEKPKSNSTIMYALILLPLTGVAYFLAIARKKKREQLALTKSTT